MRKKKEKKDINHFVFIINDASLQDKVYDEIQSLLVDDQTELSYQDYGSMRYLDNVLKETMRMYTTVPIISREISEDVELRSENTVFFAREISFPIFIEDRYFSGGYTLPAGSLANLILQHMHNNEKYFPNADKFLPERFEKKENIINFAFVPFSAGPRNCIGNA